MKFYPDIPDKVDKLRYASFKKAFGFAVNKMYFIGGRGYGKTYSTKYYLISHFMRKKEQFAWIRTSDIALKLIQNDSQFFARQDYLQELGVKSHSVVGNKIIINDEIAGYMFSVNTAHNAKGGEYQITNIVWDEFMKFGNERPVKDKRKLFFDLCESIGRGDASRIFFLSNSTNRYDEVLAPFSLDLSKGFGCYLFREENAVIHYMRPSAEYIKNAKENLSISGMTEAEQTVSLSNKFWDFGDYNKLSKAKHMYTLQVDDNSFISIYVAQGMLYIKNGKPNLDKPIFTTFANYVNSNVKRLIPAMQRIIKLYYDDGKCTFEDGYCRTVFQNIFAPK